MGVSVREGRRKLRLAPGNGDKDGFGLQAGNKFNWMALGPGSCRLQCTLWVVYCVVAL